MMGCWGPQVVQLGPGVFLRARLAGGFDGGGHALGAGARNSRSLSACTSRGSCLKALLQVARPGEGNDLLGVVRRPPTWVSPWLGWGERGLGVVVVAVEQGRGLVNLSSAAAGAGASSPPNELSR